MTTNILNSPQTTKNKHKDYKKPFCSSKTPNRTIKLDKYTLLVEQTTTESSPIAQTLRNRVDFLKDKNMGKKLKTDYERITNKNTRHTFCGCNPQKETSVSIETTIKPNHKNQLQTNNYISGTALCKEIWRCPTCSMKLLKGRATEIYDLTQAHQKEGYKLGFVTLTVRHTKRHTLKQSLDKILTNYRKFQQHKHFRHLKKTVLLGQIKSLEITNTKENGWHPHLHIIYFYKTTDYTIIEPIQNQLIKDWAKYTNGLQKSQDQQVVYTNKDITNYITKWDLSQELTNDHQKHPKGIKPFQLLTLLTKDELLFDHTDLQKSKQITKSLWLEYIETTKGKKRIITSRSLKQLYKVKDKTDEEILAEQEQSEKIISFSNQTWRIIQRNNLQPYLLYICDLYKQRTTQQQEIFKFLNELDSFYIDTRETDILNTTNESIIRTYKEKELLLKSKELPNPLLFLHN